MQVATGTSILNGIAIGPLRLYRKTAAQASAPSSLTPEEEWARFDEARQRAQEQLGTLYQKALEEVGEDNAAIFEVHQMMLEDEDYLDAVKSILDTQHVTAESAVTATGENFAAAFAAMPDGVRILNFSRADLVNIPDMKEALASGKVAAYVVDFPTEDILGVENVIAIPHLGASTPESEDNCAVMAADELIAFLEDGNIVNSVNFPTVEVPRTTERRICVLHKNVPNMLSQISGVVSATGINIETMVNKSKKDNAYTVLDVEGDPDEAALEKILAIDGVIRVRKI